LAILLYVLGIYWCNYTPDKKMIRPLWVIGGAIHKDWVVTMYTKLADFLIICVGLRFIHIDEVLSECFKTMPKTVMTGEPVRRLKRITRFSLELVDQPTTVCLMILFAVSLFLLIMSHHISSAFSAGGSLAVMSFGNIIAMRLFRKGQIRG